MSTPALMARRSTATRQRDQLVRFEDFTVSGVILAADTGSLSLAAASPLHQYYVRRVAIFVTTDAAQSATFRAKTTTTNVFAAIKTSPGVGPITIDYGEDGWAAPIGEGLEINLSAAGLAFAFVVEMFRTTQPQSSGVLTPAQAIP